MYADSEEDKVRSKEYLHGNVLGARLAYRYPSSIIHADCCSRFTGMFIGFVDSEHGTLALIVSSL